MRLIVYQFNAGSIPVFIAKQALGNPISRMNNGGYSIAVMPLIVNQAEAGSNPVIHPK